MRSRSLAELLQPPVCVNGVRAGKPVDAADGFYRDRAARFRSVLGRPVNRGKGEAGALTDLVVGPEGSIEQLVMGDRRLDFANGVSSYPGRPGR